MIQVSRHFINLDPKLNGISLTADYSMESHAKDHDNYINVSRTRKRRAKALLGESINNLDRMKRIKKKSTRKELNFYCVYILLDFERHDDDELGFRKNDIITIISQKDEHCWVGELNGLRGK